jgi:hypothetical protein
VAGFYPAPSRLCEVLLGSLHAPGCWLSSLRIYTVLAKGASAFIFCGVFYDAVSINIYITSNDRMTINELERTWRETELA